MQSRGIKTVKIVSLVEDTSIYPRFTVNDQHIAKIAEAIETGDVKLPPIIVCAKSKRIVDGFHRARATRRVFGDDSEIVCEFIEYKNDAELFLDAVRRNSGHGRTMSNADCAHAVILACRLKIEDDALARSLNVKVEKVVTLRERFTVRVEHSTKRMPLKVCVRHMEGRQLTKKQAEAIPKLGGNNATFWVEQLLLLIRSDMIDKDNEVLVRKLRELAEALEAFFDDGLVLKA